MKIGTLANEFGLRPSTLRFYENRGLLSPVGKSSGKRVYDASSKTRLSFIIKARESGLTLNEIRSLIRNAQNGEQVSSLWQDVVRSKLSTLDRSIAALVKKRQALLRKQQCRCKSLQECESMLAQEGPIP